MEFKGTTVIAVKRNNEVVMAGDGQVTFGETVMKATAKKVRKIYDGKVLAGFAGSVADAFTLFERFEQKLQKYGGVLERSAVELAKDWRTDKVLRRLEALLIAANKDNILVVSGSGEVIRPDEDIAAIGSGGMYALAAARALVKNTNLSAREIALEAMRIASSICIYTNGNITVEEVK